MNENEIALSSVPEALPDREGPETDAAPAEPAEQTTPSEPETGPDPAAEAALNRQLEQLSRLDPEIRTVEDLMALPDREGLLRQMERGLSLTEAYILTHFDRLRARQTEAGRQAARNEAEAKRHLAAAAPRGPGARPVPAEVREMYRMLLPDATEAEIRAHYGRYHR